jgi:Zn-finger nucleic acid-binding protein
MSMYASPQCPHCRSELELDTTGRLDAWICPQGHGVGLTLSEAHERAQEDELSRLWEGAKTAEPGQHACPMCDRPMASVSIGVDADEARAGHGDTPDTLRVTLDVCRDDQFIWFDPGELDELPEDLPDPKPSAEEVAQLARIRKAYDSELDVAYEDDSQLGRFADRVVKRHPGFVKFLDRVVYRDALDENAA